jgi:hypothetical protein
MTNRTLIGIMRDLIDGAQPRDPVRWASYVESQLRSVGYIVGPDPTWSPRCGCRETCGDDGGIDGPGTCKGLPRAPEPPLVEVVMVPRSAALGVRSDTEGQRADG